MEFFNSAQRSRLAARLAGSAVPSGSLFERLEQRVLLSNTPLPSLTDMENQDNTLVRMETDFGTIDLEMFDVEGPDGAAAAPLTVANFLDYIRRGEFDLSFFHRFAKLQSGAKFVLQGGGFKWDDGSGLEQVDTVDPIANEYDSGRSNLKRTISMARLGGDEGSATSQFFFNLRNNAAFLDTGGNSLPPGEKGYCVFGRVLNDDSWDVIEQIIGLTTENFYDPTDPMTGALNETPTRHDLVGEDVVLSTEELVDITNVEIIKASEVNQFYRLRAAYPEGYRGPGTVESLELVNTSSDFQAHYQVIVRYENGTGRDRVVSHGVMEPNVHLHIPVNDFNDPALDLVRLGAPYAYEVWATQQVAAALNHTDFGGATGESFVNVEQSLAADLQAWSFGGAGTPIGTPSDPDIVRRPFLVWQNLGFEAAEVTITFTLQTPVGAPVERVRWVRTTDPMRRDGLEVFNLANVKRDIASIRVTSNQRIVAALTVYDTITDPLALPPSVDDNAFTSSGVIGGALTDGVVAGARFGAEGSSYVSFVNNTLADAQVTLMFVRTNDPTVERVLTVPALGRAFYNLRNSGVPENEVFSIVYNSPRPVAGEYIATLNGDSVSTPFATRAASVSVMAGGRYDPTNPNQSEIISLFNPYSDEDIKVSITFHFSDDKIQGLAEFDLFSRSRLDISVASLSAIVAKINSGAQFANYGIEITVATGTGGGSIGAAGLVAQLTRFDQSQSITTIAGTYQFVLPLNAPAYDTQ